ncbi:MAG: hypothetical protein RLZZ338_6 [Cyanobacteriota bacterium]|jgi:hypothetical protein
MRVIKTTVLSVILMATSSLGLIAIAQNRWVRSNAGGECDVGTTCRYPLDGSRYCVGGEETIGGFYVDLTTPNSYATITWFGDNGSQYRPSGDKPIAYHTRGQHWIGFGNPGMQCFYFTITPMSNSTTKVQFDFNFDANRRR